MAQATKDNSSVANKPVHVVRYGAIKAAIWANQTSVGIMHNVTLTRSYKDGEDWKESQSFGPDDCLVAAKALNDAHSWIFANRTKGSKESN